MFFSKRIIVSVLILAGLTGFIYLLGIKHKAQTPQNKIYHYSYFSQPGFFDDAYTSAKQPPAIANAKGIIVNHHLLASRFIAETFNVVATDAPLTVLLVSPNHFDTGKADVITSSAVWKTPYGDLEPDNELINQLTTQKFASVEEPPFEQEHGISGIVAFIKESLPNAKVVPIIFRNRIKLDQVLKLADGYHQLLPKNALIVGSFDFSHYLTDRAASFHDLENLAAVQDLDTSGIYNLDIDSRPGLAFYLELMKDFGDTQFHLLENSNSAKLTHEDILETTSYITGYFFPGAVATSSANTLLSLPNITLSAEVLPLLDKRNPKYALTYLERLFYGQDKTLTFSNSRELEKVRPALSRLGIELVSDQESLKQLGTVRAKIINCGQGGKGEERVKEAVDNGADAVICQDAAKNSIQFYKNKPIVYTAGNLLSDGQNSMAVELAFQNHQLKIFLLPIAPEAGQLKLMIGKESDRVLIDIASNSNIPQEQKDEIKSGIVIINDFK